MPLSTPLSFTRKLYLINHHPIGNAHRFHEMGFSKFITLQTLNEFKDAVYNDLITGELYEDEATAKARLKADEYYLELSVPLEAVSHLVRDGHVYINRGYMPKIKALKTASGDTYWYEPTSGSFIREEKVLGMSPSNTAIYGYNPSVWDLRARAKQHAETQENLH